MKNLRAIALLFAANTVSGFAQGISMLAIPWYFTDVLNMPSFFGYLYAAVTVISLFWGVYAGTLTDRFNRKHIFLAENGAGMILVLSVAGVGYWLGNVPMPLAALVFAGTFLLYVIHYPSLYAFAQEISDPKDYARITSYLEIQGQVTNAAAGGVGALLLAGAKGGLFHIGDFAINLPTIEAWSLQKVFLLDGITYILSFSLIAAIKFTAISKRAPEMGNAKERLGKAVQFLRENPLLFMYGNVSFFVFVTVLVIHFVMMPNYVSNFLEGGANVYGIGEMCFAIGAVLSGVLVARLIGHKTVEGSIVTAALMGLAYFAVAYSRSIILFFFIMLVFGLANAGARIVRMTYLFNHVPNQVIGRTGSIFMLINVLIRLCFIAIMSLPFFVRNIGLGFVIFGLFCLSASGILLYHYKDLKNFSTIQKKVT